MQVGVSLRFSQEDKSNCCSPTRSSIEEGNYVIAVPVKYRHLISCSNFPTILGNFSSLEQPLKFNKLIDLDTEVIGKVLMFMQH